MQQNIESAPSKPFGHVTDYAERDRLREEYVQKLEQTCRTIDSCNIASSWRPQSESTVARFNGISM